MDRRKSDGDGSGSTESPNPLPDRARWHAWAVDEDFGKGPGRDAPAHSATASVRHLASQRRYARAHAIAATAAGAERNAATSALSEELLRLAAERDANLLLAALRRLSLIGDHTDLETVEAAARTHEASLLASDLLGLSSAELTDQELVAWGRLAYRQAAGKYVARAAADAGDRLLEALLPSVVLDPPRRFGVLRTSRASMITHEDWVQLIVGHLEELPDWTEGQFGRWLRDRVTARRPRRRRVRIPVRVSTNDQAVRSSFFGGASQ